FGATARLTRGCGVPTKLSQPRRTCAWSRSTVPGLEGRTYSLGARLVPGRATWLSSPMPFESRSSASSAGPRVGRTPRSAQRASRRDSQVERRVPLLEAEYAVEEEHLRVRADRERGGITEIEHRKVERVQHIRRRSREEIEHCRQLDPLKVVHAPSLLVAAVRAMSERWTEPGSAQTGSDGTCMAARHGFQPKPELRSAGLTTSDGRRKRRPRTCRLR